MGRAAIIWGFFKPQERYRNGEKPYVEIIAKFDGKRRVTSAYNPQDYEAKCNRLAGEILRDSGKKVEIPPCPDIFGEKSKGGRPKKERKPLPEDIDVDGVLRRLLISQAEANSATGVPMLLKEIKAREEAAHVRAMDKLRIEQEAGSADGFDTGYRARLGEMTNEELCEEALELMMASPEGEELLKKVATS